MKIELTLEGGARLLMRNPALLVPVLFKYVAYFGLFVGCCLCSAAAVILIGIFPFAGFAALAVVLASFFALAIAVGSWFDAALVGGVLESLSGRALSFGSFASCAGNRWLKLMEAKMLMYSFLFLLLLSFAPAAIFLLAGRPIEATVLALTAASIGLAAVAFMGIFLLPLIYVAVISEKEVLSCFRDCVTFVRRNLPETLLLWAAAMMLGMMLQAVASIFTGPLQLIPYAGLFIALPLIFISFIINSLILRALTAIWWVTLIRQVGLGSD